MAYALETNRADSGTILKSGDPHAAAVPAMAATLGPLLANFDVAAATYKRDDDFPRTQL